MARRCECAFVKVRACANPADDTMAGYSGTPLVQKLGITPGSRVRLIRPPAGYLDLLAPVPHGVEFVRQLSSATDLVHLFCMRAAELEQALPAIRRRMRADAQVWVSWPKRTSGVATDLTEDHVRRVALPMGLVDVKVCAIDEIWSGLKLVVRKELRR
jgi:hypothetical protein